MSFQVPFDGVKFTSVAMAIKMAHIHPAILLVFTVFFAIVRTTNAQEATSPHNFHFTKPVYDASIPENAPVRTYILTEPKTGIYVPLDSAITGVKYTIESETRLFRAADERVGDFYFLRIRTVPCKSKDDSCSSVINREQKSEYRLQVKAVGRMPGQASLVAYTDMIVTVTDVNDQRPLFLESEYSVNVAEDIPIQSSITTVEATDADSGTNGEVYYSFKKPTDQFAIHPTSGVVTLTRQLDYKVVQIYRLVIIARDRGMMPYNMASPFETTLWIHVQEVNKHAPLMTIQTQSQLSKNSDIGTTLFYTL